MCTELIYGKRQLKCFCSRAIKDICHHLPPAPRSGAIETGGVSSHFHASLRTHPDGKVGDAVQEGDGKSSHPVLTRTEFRWL